MVDPVFWEVPASGNENGTTCLDGAWLEAEYEGSWPQSERLLTVVRVGADYQQLRKRIERTQQLVLARRKPRRDA